ncbi:MAG TPA: isoprenylcysteine carboxylmethyltransferase family protein [Phenylobacterium sp.]|nr:isoprenylcysteine carboxylmethyltransferase family protein [Phenylobacterium sp.]
MTRIRAVTGSIVFLFLAPGMVAGAVPYWIKGWPRPRLDLLSAGGGVVTVLGALLLLECFGRFALQGRGTPAPVAPPARLVVTGPYRRVRNPMYVAVLAMIFGQAALFGSWPLAVYGLAIWAAFHVFVLAYEEPTLRRTFPDDYAAFVAAVPRWRPRLRPWRG